MQVDVSRLYKGLDLPETMSNLTGKRIRRITARQWSGCDVKTSRRKI
jgi:hypothetical protein